MTAPWLTDLKGKSVIVNGVPLPDRKTLNVTALGSSATDNPSANSTDLDLGKGELISKTTVTTNHALVVADIGYQIKMDNAGANTVTIGDIGTTIAVDSLISVLQIGAGQTSLAHTAGAGGIVFYSGGLKLKGQWSTAVLQYLGGDNWLWTGETTA